MRAASALMILAGLCLLVEITSDPVLAAAGLALALGGAVGMFRRRRS